MTTNDYLEFEADPIKFCRAYVVKFYSSEEYTSTKKSIAIADDRKQELDWYLNNFSRKTPEANINLTSANAVPTSTASTSTSTSSTQPSKGSIAPLVASVGVKPVAEDVESEKTESSSEPEIVTESSSDVDRDADDAASESEKTEES